MLTERTRAPDFTLPAAVNGEVEQLTFSEYAADQLTVLAFYTL